MRDGEFGIDIKSRVVENELRIKNRELVGLFQLGAGEAVERAGKAVERASNANERAPLRMKRRQPD